MDILMPQLGETVAEGKITRWFKAPGDAVARGDNLCEIETDKVTVEVPSIVEGVLTAINAEAGSVAPVGAIIAVVSDPSALRQAAARPAPAATARAVADPSSAPKPAAAAAAPSPALAAPAPVAEAPHAGGAARRTLDPFREVDTPRRNFGPAKLANGGVATPLARRLAADASLDLGRISGSGPRGRITRRDVEAAVAARGPVTAARPSAEEDLPVGDLYLRRPHRLVPLDGMRRTIAARLTLAKTTIPHFYLTAHIDVGRLTKLRAEINASLPKAAPGAPAQKLSLNDFMIRALALALQQVPSANAIWSSDGILELEHADIAVAVAIPGGLYTPVVMAAETKSVAAISAEMKDLAGRAKNRALRPEEYQGGSATLSNLGMHGVEEFSAIVNPPQATILALGAAHRHPVETPAGGIAFIDRLTATLSCDHRVVDGALAANLLGRFKSLIENPLQLLV